MATEKSPAAEEPQGIEEPKCISEARIPSGVGPGWYPLVAMLEYVLDGVLGAGEWRCDQVKEKFGALRFYWTATGSPTPMDEARADGVRAMAELTSLTICEECGSPAELRRSLMWMKTLCDRHYEEVEARRRV